MFVASMKIKNFRSFSDSGDIPFAQMTTFVGANGAGKSTILRAIRLFYEVNAVVSSEDFFARNTAAPLSISITFKGLTADEKGWFDKFVNNDTLSVEKRFIYVEGSTKGQYFGQFLQHPEFTRLRGLSPRDKISAYKQLRQGTNAQFADLPSARSSQDVDTALAEWEKNHNDQLERVTAQVPFFGARNVGGGSLDNFTRFVLVPAVREAAQEGTDGKGGALGELLNILVREVLLQRQDLIDFRRRTIEEFRRIASLENLPEIPQLESRLTERLRTFVPKSAVHLSLSDVREPSFGLPETRVELTEDNFRGNIEGKGHGLQRSFIISIIHELAIVQAQRDEQIRRLELGQNQSFSGDGDKDRIAIDFNPDLILAIEEPELFQHPIRQRYFANMIANLTSVDGDAGRSRVQVIISTHSPYFVTIHRFDEIRVVSKQQQGDDVGSSEITVGDASKANSMFCKSRQIQNPNVNTFLDGLRNIVDTNVSEAFFSKCAVVVEGDDDRAAVEAALKFSGVDSAKDGISVIPADGKCNIGRIRCVLESLGISSYLLFDCDGSEVEEEKRKRNQKENKSLFALCGSEDGVKDPFPKLPIVSDCFACFPIDIEKTLEDELKEYNFFERRNAIASQKKLGAKHPVVYETVLLEAQKRGAQSRTLELVAAAIKELAKV